MKNIAEGLVVYVVAATCENGVAVLRCKTRPQTIIRVLYVARRLGLPLLAQWRPGLRVEGRPTMATLQESVITLDNRTVEFHPDGSATMTLMTPAGRGGREQQYNRIVTRLLEVALEWSRRDG